MKCSSCGSSHTKKGNKMPVRGQRSVKNKTSTAKKKNKK